MKEALKKLRHDYNRDRLIPSKMPESPFSLVETWLKAAHEHGYYQPNAMTLATSDPTGQASARIVLLKDIVNEGFVFFTNYESRKGRDLEDNHLAALLFYWDKLERQIRIEGQVSKVSEADSKAYFYTRPRGSQIGAWVSPQSQKIESREILDSAQSKLESEFKEDKVPYPEHWGGYVLKPKSIEFWQGRQNRLHDRILYENLDNDWSISRLAP